MTQKTTAPKAAKKPADAADDDISQPRADSLNAQLAALEVGDCHSVSMVYPCTKPIDIRSANEDKNKLTRRLTNRVWDIKNKYPTCAKREFEVISTTGLTQVGYLVVTAVVLRTK